MSKQTTIQVPSAIRIGSVKVLVGNDSASLVDIGALRNPVFKSLAENQVVKFDNVADLTKFVLGKRFQVTFDLAEIKFDNLSVLDGGILNLATVAASPVTVTGEAKGTGWVVGKPIKLNNKNGANTIVGSIVIKAAGTPLTLTTNYVTYVGDGTNGELGATYITPVTASAAVITADYSYTPNASKKLTFNDSGTKTLKYMRLVNTDNNGKEFRVDIQNGTNFAPLSVDFAGDAQDDVAILPVDFQGDIVEWVDEQQTA